MCGIFVYVGPLQSIDRLNAHFMKMKHRGPDDTQLLVQYTASGMIAIGFHRLSINGINTGANQPLLRRGTVTVCNGEIWNYADMHALCSVPNQSGSDCEAIPAYFHHQRDAAASSSEECFASMCRYIDGVFGMVVYDSSEQAIYVGRDRIGIRSLYYGSGEEGLYITSEMKSIPAASKPMPFPPGCWAKIAAADNPIVVVPVAYWEIPIPPPRSRACQIENQLAYAGFCSRLRHCLVEAVRKRLILSERPIGCVLSGGLDSSIITSIVCKLHNEINPGAPPIRTYTIGLRDAEDIKWAKIAADHVGSDHHEFIIEERELLDAIPHVIEQIESFDVTTVRASAGNWLLAKKIAEIGKDKVIFSGDVADELLGGYRGFGLTDDREAFERETTKMVQNVHQFDVLRCEKSFAGHGLESRVPFADRDFIDLVMNAPAEYKMWDGKSRIEKDCLRRAFVENLPSELVWRRKEAFSDGISQKSNSWSGIIKKHVREQILQLAPCDWHGAQAPRHAPPYDSESAYYRHIFDGMYNSPECIPYLWKQPFSKEEDPSARFLGNYEE